MLKCTGRSSRLKTLRVADPRPPRALTGILLKFADDTERAVPIKFRPEKNIDCSITDTKSRIFIR